MEYEEDARRGRGKAKRCVTQNESDKNGRREVAR
jgi:hypothetical protein